MMHNEDKPLITLIHNIISIRKPDDLINEEVKKLITNVTGLEPSKVTYDSRNCKITVTFKTVEEETLFNMYFFDA